MALKLYTSRYTNKELRNVFDYYYVGISMGKPKFSLPYIVNEQIYMFAPSRDIWNLPEEEFKKSYKERLDKYGIERVKSFVDGTVKRSNGKKVVFLCYEDVRVDGEFCHRTALAEWIRDNLGYEVEELNDPTPPKIKKQKRSSQVSSPSKNKEDNHFDQMSLFDLHPDLAQW